MRILNILGSSKLKTAQINACMGLLELMSSGNLKVDGKYASLFSNNRSYLSFSGSNIDNLDFLEGNTKVTSFDISSCKNLTNSCTTVLSSLTQLTKLKMSKCSGISDYSFLSSLTNIKTLDLDLTKVDDAAIRSIPNKGDIVELDLAYCLNIRDASIYADFNLPLLKWMGYYFDIRGDGTPSTADLSFLNDSGYTAIYLQSCGDITTCQQAISNCTNNFYVSSSLLGKFAECTQLTYLRMAENQRNSRNFLCTGENDILNLNNCKLLTTLYLFRKDIEHVYVSGCNGISNEMCQNMIDAGVTIIK